MMKPAQQGPCGLISFDIEEFDLPCEFGVDISGEDLFSISGDGTRAILDVLKKTGIRATFFITAVFAQHFPSLLHEMVQDGHEIASHGLSHSAFVPGDLKESKIILEKISSVSISGFRMARLATVKKEDIQNAGYWYESSLNPVWLPGRYNHFSSPLKPFYESCGLIQVPVSALPGVRFPLFWLSFKNLPLSLYLPCSKWALSSTGFLNLYTHPWEYTARSAEPQWKIPAYIVRHAGEEQCNRLKTLIHDLQRGGTVFRTFSEFLHLTMKKNG